MAGIRLAQDGVLPHQIQGLYLSLADSAEHLGYGQAGRIGQGGSPGSLELLFYRRLADFLVAAVDIGQGAHIAGPLDVVLAP